MPDTSRWSRNPARPRTSSPSSSMRADETIRRRLYMTDWIGRCLASASIEYGKAFLIVANAFGSFDAYILRFAGRGPKSGRRKALKQIPARTKESDEMSEDLKSRGFKFVGSTICYAYMQAVGMVNDHLTDCFRSDQRYGIGTRPGPGGSRRK